MENGETAEDCIKREIREELRCNIISLKFFEDYGFAGGKFRVFEVKLDSEPNPDRKDFEEWGWFDGDAIKEMEFALDCKERLADYFRRQN